MIRRDIAAGISTAVAVGTAGTIDRPSVSGDGRVLAYTVLPVSPIGGTIIVKAGGEPDRVFPGAFGQVSHDGAFLSGIQYTGDSGGPAFRIHLRSGERRLVGSNNLFSVGAASGASPSGRFVQGSTAFFGDFVHGSWTARFFSHGVVAFDRLDRWLVFEGTDLAPQRTFEDLLALPIDTFFDNDEDGLNDHWELLFGLNQFGSTGDGGPDGDPDHDGLTNAQELAAGSNPVGTLKRFLAEGTSSPDFFSTRIAIVNPGSVDAKVAVRFDAGDGVGNSRALVVPARTRVTLDSHAEQMDGFSFSTVVDSDQPLVVDRLVSWGTAASGVYGSHAETSTAAPATTWLLAEGSTVLGFQLFYLLQNPGAAAATATIRFLRPSGAPLVRTYELAPRSRTTVYVNTIPSLESTDVSAEITATQPIAVERAMYRSTAGQTFALGHDAAAVAAPSTSWFFGEGATERLLRHLPAAGQSVGAARVRSGRPTCVTRAARSAGPTRCLPAAASASTSTASREWMRRRSAHASRRRCRSSPSVRCTGPAASSATTKDTSPPARRRRARTGSWRRARSSAPTPRKPSC